MIVAEILVLAIDTDLVGTIRTDAVFPIFGRRMRVFLPSRTHYAIGKETGETNPIERFNKTLRQRLGLSGTSGTFFF